MSPLSRSSAAKGDYWLNVFSFLKNADLTVYNELRIFIDAPQTSKSFAVIAANLIDILRLVLSCIESRRDTELARKIPWWIDYCEQIVRKKDAMASEIPDFCVSGDAPFKPPLRGAYTTHPLGVALWCSVKNQDLVKRYRLLQANLILAYHYLKDLEEVKKYFYKNAKEAACRASRYLADPDNAAMLESLPDSSVVFDRYCRAVLGLPEPEGKQINDLKILFKYALQGKKGITHASKKRLHYNSPFQHYTQSIDMVEEEARGSSEKVHVLKVQAGSRVQSRKQIKYLCSPDEFTSARETVVCEDSGDDPSGGLSPGQQFFRAKASISAIAMHNQRLGSDWDTLTQYEVSKLLSGLDMLGAQNKDLGGIPSAEVAAYLSVLFWLSAPPDVAASCEWVQQPSSCKSRLGILWEGPTKLWVVKPRRPEQNHVPEDLLKQQALPLSARYVLPIPAMAHLTMQHFDKFSGKKEPSEVFNRTPTEYIAAAENFLNALRDGSGGRQTLQRVSRYVHDYLARMPGSDVTAAMAISGRADLLGAVPLHYTAHSVQKLQELYAAACVGIMAATGKDVHRKTADETVVTPGADRMYAGSMYVPSRTTVKRLIEDLRKRMEEARGNLSNNIVALIQLHNDLTVYTVMMLGFATGYRAVHDPLLQEAEIDRASGFAVISDKDDDQYHHARIVWLPDLCIKQMDLYREHLDQLQGILFLMNQDLFFKVRGRATTGRGANRENPSLFLLDAEIDDLPVQPRYLERLVRKIDYQLPMNANRHYLRTNLFSRKCPIEVINAFMGHVDRGNEPWGMYSGLSPLVYLQELRKCLVPLMDEDGWCAESGLKAKGRM